MIAGPPFDGHPCPVCPIEVRDFYATAHNFLSAYRDGDDLMRTARKLAAFERSLDRMEKIVHEHFSDPRHSHGPGPRLVSRTES